MLLLEHFPELLGWDVKIVGTDIARTVVEYAQRGVFRRIEMNRGLPARMLVKYFVRRGEEWEVSAKVKEMCEFRMANLCAPLPVLPEFDVVMLRNVLLYFPLRDRRRVFAEVHRQMQPKGYLMLGNAEQAEDSTDQFATEFAEDCYFYRPVL
jgi:chemotaxis protein methyltransferase CheR